LNRIVAGFGRVKMKAQIENLTGREERDFDQTAFTLFQKATGSRSLRRAARLNAILAQVAEDKAFRHSEAPDGNDESS
jgi:hypothetical protein